MCVSIVNQIKETLESHVAKRSIESISHLTAFNKKVYIYMP